VTDETKTDTGIVNIHGRAYKTVALRVGEFRADCPITDGWSITTTILKDADDIVIIKASMGHPDGRVVATGLAEEKRGASQINRTSALENCETSAIGRMLAAAGYGGSEYASANEVENAIQQQDGGDPEPESRNGMRIALDDAQRDVVDKLMEHRAELCATWEPDADKRRARVFDLTGRIFLATSSFEGFTDMTREEEKILFKLVAAEMSADIDKRNAA